MAEKERKERKEKTADNHTKKPTKKNTKLKEQDKITNLKYPLTLNECPISFVTVYNDRAEVTRTINFESTDAGVQDLIISGFVPTVNPDSFRVSGGTGSAVILEVSFEEVNFDKTLQEQSQKKAKEYEDSLQHLENQVKVIDNKLSVINHEQQWIKQYATSSIENQREVASFPISELPSFFDFISETNEKLDEETATLKKEKEALKTQITDLKDKQKALGIEVFTTQRRVTISMSISAKEKIKLALSYVISGASWKSKYDVRVKGTEMNLFYLALITNKTSEDWNNVELVLSTASPSLGGEPPKLYPLKYDISDTISVLTSFAQSSVSSARQPRRLSITMERGSSRFEELLKPIKAIEPPQSASTVQAGATSVNYTIPRKCTILSDNKPHKVDVAKLPINIKFQYIIIPSKSQHAYLKAVATNTSDYQLLDGEINVFMDERYVASSQLKKAAPGEEFSIYLGTDAEVKVTPKPTFKQDNTGGILKKTTTKITIQTAEITNNKNATIVAMVYMELPFTSIPQDIKIKREEPPLNAPNVTIDNNSVLCWKLEIPSGKKEKVKLKYTVEHPEEKPVYFVKQESTITY